MNNKSDYFSNIILEDFRSFLVFAIYVFASIKWLAASAMSLAWGLAFPALYPNASCGLPTWMPMGLSNYL